MATSTIVFALVGRDRASATFRQVGRSANRLASTTSKVGAAIKTSLTVGAVAVAGIGAAAIKTAGDFEKNMNRVAALSGATGKELAQLRNQAKELGRTTQYGATQSADAMAQLATAGLTVTQILGSMPSVLALASSEQLDLTRAAEITTNVLTGYGMSIKEIPHAVDAMVKASVKANTSVDDLGEAFKYSGPIAHQAGLQFEEAVAATALMGNAGIKASMAGTALRGAVTRLLSPTDKVADTLKKLGVNVSTADGKLRPLTSIVDQLAKKGATTGDIMTIFGQRAGPGMAALIQQGSKKLAGLTKELENSGGTADRISKIQMKGWRGEITRLKNAWEGLMIEIGDTGLLTGATKALSGVTLAVRNLAGWVNDEGIPKVKAFSSSVADMIPVGAIQQRVGQAKAVVTDFWTALTGSKAPKPAKAAKPVMKGALDLSPHLDPSAMPKTKPVMKGALDLSPHLDPSAMPKTKPVMKGALDLSPHLDPQKVKPPKPPKSLATQIGEQMRVAFTDGISSIKWNKIGSTIGDSLADGLGKLAENSVKLTTAFGKLLAGIDWVGIGISLGKFVPSLLLGFIVGLLNFDMAGLLKGLASHWQDVLLAVLFVAFLPAKWAGAIGKALGKIPFLGKLLKWAFEIFTKFSKQIVGWAGKLLAGFGRGFLTGLKTVFPGLGRLLTSGVERLALGILGYSGRFVGFGERVIKGLGTGIIKGAEGLGTVAGRVIGPILKPFVRAGSWLISRGVAVVKGFSSGIVTGAKAVGGFAKTWIIDPVVGVFKTSGSWLWSRGSALVSGFKSGVVTGAKAVGGFAKTWIIDPVVGAFKGAGTWLWSRGAALVSGFKSGVVTGAKGIGGWILRNVISPSISVFLKAGTWLFSKGTALISGLKSGIVSGIKGIGSWIKSNIIDPVVSAVKSFFGIHSPSTVFAEIGGYLVSGLFKGLASTSGTAIAKKVFGDLPSALGSIVKKGIVSVASLPGKAMSALGSLGGKLGGFFKGLFGGGGGGGGAVGGAVSQWTPQVAQVLSMLGVPATAIGPVLKRIQMESGGNPNAINLWDSNAKAGHPSQGLMQTIPGTFAAYAGPFRGRGITDPLANIYAGVNYAMHRYGAGWLSVMTRPGGYAKGTGGGLAPIGQTAWVGEKGAELMQVTSKGTRILSHEESMAYARANGVKLPGYASGTAKSRKSARISPEARSRNTARIAVQNSINNGFRKTLTTGTAAAIVSAVKAMITRLQKAGLGKAFTDKVLKQSDRMQALAAKKASVGSRINQAKAFAADQASTITDYLSISGTTAPSVAALISQMTGQQKTATNMAKLTASLRKRGASSGLLEQLAAAGPGSQLANILGSVTSADIKKLNGLMASGAKLATSFGNAMADAMYDSGSQAAKGFLAGLKAQQASLEAQMGKLADALLKSIKSKLKIKSPSRVFRDQVGRQVALGTAAGIDAHVPAVVSSAQRMADSAAGVSTNRVVIPGPATSGAAQQAAAVQELVAAIEAAVAGSGSEVHVHFDDDRLKDLIDVRVKPKIKASEKQQAYRGKVGLRG